MMSFLADCFLCIDLFMKQLRIEVIERAYAAILAAKSPAERAWMIGDCHRSARVILTVGERSRHPDWTEEQVSRTVSDRLSHGPN
jgi:hypothetical protein